MKMPKFNRRRGKAEEKQEVAKENDSDAEPEQQNGGDLEMGETQVDRVSSRRNRSRNEDRGGSSKRDDDDDDDENEQEEQQKLKRQQGEDQDEGSDLSGEHTSLLERDGSPRRNSPRSRRQRRASTGDGDSGDDEENENDNDERDRSEERADRNRQA